MSELNVNLNGSQRAIPAPATVADAIKAFDRDILKSALAAKVNGEEVDLNRELTPTDDLISIEPITFDTHDGLEVLRSIRAEGNSVPVIMLTAKTQVDDKVEGLELGANDYVTKPYNARELVARIKAAGRPRSGATSLVNFGDLTIRADTLELSTKRGTLRVDPHEMSFVSLLARAGGRTVESTWLLERVWEGDAPDGTLSLYASFINGKLQALGSPVSVVGSDEEGWRMVGPDGEATQG